jgi:hypothetical protein
MEAERILVFLKKNQYSPCRHELEQDCHIALYAYLFRCRIQQNNSKVSTLPIHHQLELKKRENIIIQKLNNCSTYSVLNLNKQCHNYFR